MAPTNRAQEIMRELFDEVAGKSPLDPREASRKSSRTPLRKRFYTSAGVAEGPDGFAVTLDGKLIRTPGKNALVAPTRELAEAMASEWEAQPEMIDPMAMPLTRLANSVIDGVAGNVQAVADDAAKYFETDLLFYRAGFPEALIARQAEHWDPALRWAAAWPRDSSRASRSTCRKKVPAGARAQPFTRTTSPPCIILPHLAAILPRRICGSHTASLPCLSTLAPPYTASRHILSRPRARAAPPMARALPLTWQDGGSIHARTAGMVGKEHAARHTGGLGMNPGFPDTAAKQCVRTERRRALAEAESDGRCVATAVALRRRATARDGCFGPRDTYHGVGVGLRRGLSGRWIVLRHAHDGSRGRERARERVRRRP